MDGRVPFIRQSFGRIFGCTDLTFPAHGRTPIWLARLKMWFRPESCSFGGWKRASTQRLMGRFAGFRFSGPRLSIANFTYRYKRTVRSFLAAMWRTCECIPVSRNFLPKGLHRILSLRSPCFSRHCLSSDFVVLPTKIMDLGRIYGFFYAFQNRM